MKKRIAEPTDDQELENSKPRQMRADGQRKMSSILEAAMQVFRKSGVDAPVREILALKSPVSSARPTTSYWLGARDVTLGEASAVALKAEGTDVRFIHIDLNKMETIQAAAASIEADYGRLDVLVNNAGIADRADGPPSKTGIDAVRHIFDTNFFGTLAVTQAMLPLLRKSLSGRIVNVSSGLGSLTHNGDPSWEFAQAKFLGYNSSKAALNMLTVQLASELKNTRIKVNSADPGFTATDLNNHRGHQSIPEGAAGVVHLALLPDDSPTGGFFSTSDPQPWQAGSQGEKRSQASGRALSSA
jgi:NAD(P)-dependent dehydrogenase (short-subunit alcohol dehydrogenase family)